MKNLNDIWQRSKKVEKNKGKSIDNTQKNVVKSYLQHSKNGKTL